MKTKEKIRSYLDKKHDVPIYFVFFKIIAAVFLLSFATNYFKHDLRSQLLFTVSLTHLIVVGGVFAIFIVVECMRWKNIWGSTPKILLLEYHKIITTALGFIAGSFFVLITILWSQSDPLPRLRDHTLIGLGFLVFILINGYDLLNIIQRRIRILELSSKPKKKSLEILKMRYAKGEITKEEYEEMKKNLKD